MIPGLTDELSHCPTCRGEMFNNIDDPKRPEKAPPLRCKNKNCKDAKGYTSGRYLTDAQIAAYHKAKANGAAPAAGGQASAPTAPPTHRLSQDEFVLITNDLTEVLLTNLAKVCATLNMDVPCNVLVEQACTTVRQAWIECEKGVIRLGPEPAAPPIPVKPADDYRQRIAAATTVVACAELVMAVATDLRLTGDEKGELAEMAKDRRNAIDGDKIPF